MRALPAGGVVIGPHTSMVLGCPPRPAFHLHMERESVKDESTAIRTCQQVADIMTKRGVKMTATHVHSTEQRALRKLRRALTGREK